MGKFLEILFWGLTITNAIFIFANFILILIQGSFYIQEPNTIILIAEIILSGIYLVVAAYYFDKWWKRKTVKDIA